MAKAKAVRAERWVAYGWIGIGQYLDPIIIGVGEPGRRRMEAVYGKHGIEPVEIRPATAKAKRRQRK